MPGQDVTVTASWAPYRTFNAVVEHGGTSGTATSIAVDVSFNVAFAELVADGGAHVTVTGPDSSVVTVSGVEYLPADASSYTYRLYLTGVTQEGEHTVQVKVPGNSVVPNERRVTLYYNSTPMLQEMPFTGSTDVAVLGMLLLVPVLASVASKRHRRSGPES
jgi:hypothetical protein